MDKKTFNPLEWLEQPNQQTINIDTEPKVSATTNNVTEVEVQGLNQIEEIIQQIENKQIDIATAYSDWRNIGFAFADEFGENGRDFFHRISRFYSDYSTTECDHQFDNCLKAKGQGVSLKTFFFHAKQAGIPISNQKQEPDNESEKVPHFPESLYTQLPDFLKRVVQICTSNEERDIMLLGSLVTLSACLPKIHGIYDGKRVFANLYLFITAQASAGKGRLVHCKQLVKPIHKALREQARLIKQEYEIELSDYNSKKGKEEGVEKPNKPQEKMLFIPANNSTTGVFQLLSDNDGKGLIFETEGDTLSQAFKSDYGNYSDGFRKAFHHETISYYRRTDREYVDIESPSLSTVLSGTPKQISSLIPNAENGLFSRFIFYYMNINPVWKDVFAITSAKGLDDYFDELGNEFHELYKSLMANPEIQFCLSADQQSQFNDFFAHVQTKYIAIQGLDYMATVRRLGLVAFRMAMVLSVLRIFETGDLPEQIICEEQDFQSALEMIKILVQHSSKVFSELPEDVKPQKRSNRKERFLEQLPLNFNRQKYLDVANSLSIPYKTAEGYITEFYKKGLIHRESQDQYINLTKETQDSKDVKA
ncbi:DUF3987 domain-containing protein [Lentimicrobium sp. L6]|uniref:DUF3987 domain-containing protein n=1 Tax=Lentimicrobium sp. L6 TaxID=2735916 RepID=UPI0015534ECC|nr:DUF3987 domain-containing protein [Lentimicrobium sp. L6]NPD86437.1 DUF3987 domain-containing protein [Lentimicrobium sp. L6]